MIGSYLFQVHHHHVLIDPPYDLNSKLRSYVLLQSFFSGLANDHRKYVRILFVILCDVFAGCRDLKATDVNKLRAALPGLEDEIAYPSAFENFYQYAFRFCLTVRVTQNALQQCSCVWAADRSPASALQCVLYRMCCSSTLMFGLTIAVGDHVEQVCC